MVSALQAPYQPQLPLGTKAAVPSLCIAKHKPIGGFVPITVIQLCLVWWLYRSKQILPLDVRVWFACHEMGEHARRCRLATGQIPHYTVDELRQVLRLRRGPHAIRASLRRLKAKGLLTWDPSSLRFATAPRDLQDVDLTGYYRMMDGIENNRRSVPVPRQMIRLIAEGCRRVRLAVLLGHLMRCLYYHKEGRQEGRCVSGGRCKASWIARVFGVDQRHIRAERQHLLALGILEAGPQSEQWELNRWGPWSYISLTWTQAGIREATKSRFDTCINVQEKDATGWPYPPTAATTEWPSPCLNSEPLRGLGEELNHQKPLQEPAPAAVSAPPSPPSSSPADTPGIQSVEDTTPQALPLAPPSSSPAVTGDPSGKDNQPKCTPLLAPTLRHIVVEDLQQTDRLLALLEQAQRQGLIGRRQPDRLTFVAMAERALRVGEDNPCGLFATMLHDPKLRCFLADVDDDVAQKRLKAYDYGSDAQHRASPPPPPSPPPAPSKDAWCVHGLQRELGRHGFDGDVFALLRQEDPDHWTETHCQTIAQELVQVQHSWQQAKASQMQSLGELAMEDGYASWGSTLTMSTRR